MSDSDDEIDYVEILKNLNTNNKLLQYEEVKFELKTKYEDALKTYNEQRDTFLKMKEDFETDQLKILKSTILIADLRFQCEKQVKTLENLLIKSESLDKVNSAKQTKFDEIVSTYNKNIKEVSVHMDEEILLKSIVAKKSQKELLMDKIEAYKYNTSKMFSSFINVNNSCELKEINIFTQSVLKDTKYNEKNSMKLKELKIDIEKYGALTENMQKKIL